MMGSKTELDMWNEVSDNNRINILREFFSNIFEMIGRILIDL